MSWTDLLATALAADPGRPLLTFYDDATGERVELSVATYANWVAKTANLLVDGLAVDVGDVVAVPGVPRHWQLAVWAGATWSVGAVLAVAVPAQEPAVAVVGPGVLADPRPEAADVVALSLRPLGGPFVEPLPAGVLDYAREVAGYGDRFTGPAPGAGAPALLEPSGAAQSHADLVDRGRGLADRWGLGPGGRLLVAGPLGAVDEVLAAAVVPLVVGGSVVLVSHPDPSRSAARAEQERVTAAVPG